MKHKYRIREQYGLFFIEKEVERIINNWKRGWFANKVESTEIKLVWITVCNPIEYNLHTRHSEYLSFNTLIEAKDFIKKLDPKYHTV